MKKSSNKGFTLVELIIVIAILAIIMLIAIPNFSGIQQRMQVRADKATAAQIGKAVRIWYTEYQSDPAFKAVVDAGTKLPQAASTGTGVDMVQLANLTSISGYVDSTLVPSSLRLEAGTTDTAKKYWLGLVGVGTSEKVVVSIANAAPKLPNYGAGGATGLSARDDVQYDGSYRATQTFKQTLAYMEP